MVRTPILRGPLMAAAPLAFALVAVLAIVANTIATSGAPATPIPSLAPSQGPSEAPSDSPDPQPADDIADGQADVVLDTATGHEVVVSVVDHSGSVADVESGRAGDGMSVQWFDVQVENVDDSTVRVTWVGLPRDEVIALTVSESDVGYALDFVQAAPPANSDAIGFDRVLVIRFETPLEAADIEVDFREGVPGA